MLGCCVVDEGKDPPAHPPRSVPSLGATRDRPLPRREHIAATRAELPIIAMEQEIMSMVDEHDVVLLCGATGCGKTTQVPQFLLEAGFGCKEFVERGGMIGVTQPRRVAAVSTARRVAEEVGDDSSKAGLVGYQVRYDREVGTQAAVKFMTDGILMRELQEDFLLTKYGPFLCCLNGTRFRWMPATVCRACQSVCVYESYSSADEWETRTLTN